MIKNLKNKFFADIHMHPIMKSFNSGHPKPKYNPWEFFEHERPTTTGGRFVSRNSPDMEKCTQANFYKLMDGQVRVLFNSFYPFERGFFNIRNLPKLATGRKAKSEMMAVGSGIGMDRAAYLARHVDYWEELNDEYAYLMKHQGKSPNGKFEYAVVSNYTQLQDVLKKENSLAVIPTIEGCHALFDSKMLSGKLKHKEMKERLLKNIMKLKEWEHPPFFVTLMHHFYNGLGGHAKSLKAQIGNNVLNQNKRLEKGIEGLGIKALKELLSNRNGKRIHIDTKHMSLKTRKEYYRWIMAYNYLDKTDIIPVICSHGGVNGFKTMQGSLRKNDTEPKRKRSYFNNWAINMSDEELGIIHESKGLFGLIIDKGIISGGKFMNKIGRIKDEIKIKEEYCRLIWDNILQGVRSINKKTAWDIFSLGTDYDGAINHIPPYDGADRLPDLYMDLYRFMDKYSYMNNLWFGYKPEEILDKIFYKNVMDFCERNFV